MATSRKKSPVVIFDRRSPTGKEKRPDHPDFRTTEEHKKAKLTGVRKNEMALQWEFWILGNIERTVSFDAVMKDKNALTKVHAELFGFHMPPKEFMR